MGANIRPKRIPKKGAQQEDKVPLFPGLTDPVKLQKTGWKRERKIVRLTGRRVGEGMNIHCTW